MRNHSKPNNHLKVDAIQQINDGIIVMKHFFELNVKLLPIYFDLNIKAFKNVRDYLDIDKIATVFDSYHFDSKASRILLNSNVLDYIQHAYFVIQNNSSSLEDKQNALNLFLSEYKKLKSKWSLIDAN
ncbi:MAG: hypothetical protein V4622_13430 [Bacteroidota bacterium]